MKVKENVSVYTCDFCKKRLFRKHAMIKHENGCSFNPKNLIPCLQGCKYLINIDLHFDVLIGHHYDGEPILQSRNSGCFKCVKKDQLMYSFAAEKRSLPAKYPDDFEDQEAMPKIICELFKVDELPF